VQASANASGQGENGIERQSKILLKAITTRKQTCHGLLEGLNRESEAIDPKDAEQVAENLATNCELIDFVLIYDSRADLHYLPVDNNIQERSRWRRRVVKDNYNELKEQLIAAQVRETDAYSESGSPSNRISSAECYQG
jgi:hypothetical protein